MTVVATLASIAAALYLAAALILTVRQRQSIFPGAFSASSARSAAPPGFEATTVVTEDGERLRALWKAPRPGCGVVLAFHGNGDVPERPAERFGRGAWAADGWGVLTIAYRGYAGSTGTPSGVGLVSDALAAYDELRRREPSAPVLVHGHSLGTWPAISVASARPVLALYLEAPFRSMASLIAGLFPWLPTTLLLRDPMRSDLRLPDVRAPVVIVHGDADGIVPAASGRALAATRPADTTFDLVAADHMSVLGAEDDLWGPRFAAMLGPTCHTS